MALLEESLTKVIKGCFYDVQNEVGLGFDEEAYHQGLIRAFTQKGLRFRSKEPVPVMYRGKGVTTFEPDFDVEERVIVELKALREGFAQEHYVQLFSYLKATRRRIGFLVNFGQERVVDERYVFDEKPFALDENWENVAGQVAGEERERLMLARQSAIEVGQEFGFGYGDVTYRKLLTAVVEAKSVATQERPLAQPRFHNDPVGHFECHCLRIGPDIIALVLALKDGLERLDIRVGESYLKNLGYRFGVVANFAKDRLQLHGIANPTVIRKSTQT